MSASRQRPASHLLPTLFDRLCDDTPNQKRDHDISVSPVQLKEIILRDLSFLLNTVSHEDDIDAARYPHAAASVLNYGLPPLAGSFLYEHKWDDIRRAILRTITRFEPRLKASTLQIIPLQDERRQSGHNTLQFEIRGEILTQPYPTAFRVRDVERSLSALRPADALAPESVRQQLADLEARGTLPLDAFRQAAETTERLQRHARETLNDQAPDFSRLTQLLALLPGAVQSTTPEILPQPQAEQPENATIVHTEQMQAEQIALPVHIAEEISPMTGAAPRQIRDRNDALERLRVIRRWFEHSEPSSPTIPLLRQAERLVGKRFSEVINEIPVELLEKWDALE